MLLLGVITPHKLHAQITVGSTPDRYYTSMQDYVSDRYVVTPFLCDYDYDGSGLIRFDLPERAWRKTLRKQARIVVHQDSLLLNLRHLTYQGFDLGNGYVQAWDLCDSTLLFFAPDAGWKAFGRTFGIAMGTAVLTLGLSGGMYYASAFVNGEWACYTYSGHRHKVLRIDREAALALLHAYNPQLSTDYQSLSPSQQKKKATINRFMYQMVQQNARQGRTSVMPYGNGSGRRWPNGE